nr:lysoplasmalogenase [uncultured Ornithinimicrobium sp.]
MGSRRWFVPGLVSFLAAHVAYVVGLLLAPTSPGWMLVGLALVAAAAVAAVPRLARLRRGEHASLLGPVVAYLVVISAMVVTAFGTAHPWAVAGAVLFYVSDATLAWNRFLTEHRRGPTVVMVTYHLGQAGLVGWLVQG